LFDRDTAPSVQELQAVFKIVGADITEEQAKGMIHVVRNKKILLSPSTLSSPFTFSLNRSLSTLSFPFPPSPFSSSVVLPLLSAVRQQVESEKNLPREDRILDSKTMQTIEVTKADDTHSQTIRHPKSKDALWSEGPGGTSACVRVLLIFSSSRFPLLSLLLFLFFRCQDLVGPVPQHCEEERQQQRYRCP
jgi:hypothetical protein